MLQMSTVNLQMFQSSRMRKDQSSKDTKERTFCFLRCELWSESLQTGEAPWAKGTLCLVSGSG